MIARAVLVILAVALFLSEAGIAQEKQVPAKFKDGVSCDEFAAATTQVMGKAVGVEQCQIVSEETVFNIKGHKFRRVEMRKDFENFPGRSKLFAKLACELVAFRTIETKF